MNDIEREAFEDAASRIGYSLKMRNPASEDGEYLYEETQDAWNLWQEKTCSAGAVPEWVAKVHDELLVLSTYPDDYPMGAMLNHLVRFQRKLNDLLTAAPTAPQTGDTWKPDAGEQQVLRNALKRSAAPVEGVRPSETSIRRARLFLDGLGHDGCSEMDTLRKLLDRAHPHNGEQGGERAYPVHQKCGAELKGRYDHGQQVTCPGCGTHGEALVDDGGVDFFWRQNPPTEREDGHE